jgi:uncharacterized protein (DUF4415 family)
MKPKMVSYTLQNMPELTDEQRTNLKRLASLPYSEIDTSDIPEMTEERFKLAVQQGIHRGLYRPVKKQITAKVDADVLEWLKSKGKGYQTRVNAILRREMLAEVQGKAS